MTIVARDQTSSASARGMVARSLIQRSPRSDPVMVVPAVLVTIVRGRAGRLVELQGAEFHFVVNHAQALGAYLRLGVEGGAQEAARGLAPFDDKKDGIELWR